MLTILCMLIHAMTSQSPESLEIPIADGKVTSLIFSPDNNNIAIGIDGRETKVLVHEIKTLKKLTEITFADRGRPFSLAFSSDGQNLAVADFGLSVKIIATSTWKEAFALKGDPNDKVYRQARKIAWLPDGKSLLVGYSTGDIYLWDVSKKLVVKKFLSQNAITTLSIANSGKYFATGSKFGLRIWEIETGKTIAKIEENSTGRFEVQDCTFVNNDEYIASVDHPGKLRFFVSTSGESLHQYEMPLVGKQTTIPAIVAASSNAVIIPGFRKKEDLRLETGLITYDVKLKKVSSFISADTIKYLATTADGKKLATATDDNGDSVRLFKINQPTSP